MTFLYKNFVGKKILKPLNLTWESAATGKLTNWFEDRNRISMFAPTYRNFVLDDLYLYTQLFQKYCYQWISRKITDLVPWQIQALQIMITDEQYLNTECIHFYINLILNNFFWREWKQLTSGTKLKAFPFMWSTYHGFWILCKLVN